MSLRLACAAFLTLAVAVPVGSAPAEAANNSYQRQKRFSNYCKPPLKFAAGACVRRCPAGYRDTGRYCSFRNMNR